MAGLRTLAESDLGAILEDAVHGFGWPITLTNPAGVALPFTGFSNDVSALIDPDTGQVVSGRQAGIVLRLSSLYAAGFTIPEGISDASIKPWLGAFDDINGTAYTFKIVAADPDRALGVVACILETYKP